MMYVCIYIYIYIYIYAIIYTYIYRESNHGEKTACLKNVFDSRLYQFIVFTFLQKPLHKIFHNFYS